MSMKTIPASSFHALAARPRGRERHISAIHGVWRRIHGGFRLPQRVCNHDEGWEVYDADLAGCTLCGVQHACSEGSCATEANEQGHRVCPVTGLCVRTLVFSESEFVDTVSHDTLQGGGYEPAPSPRTTGAEAWGHLVLSYARHILCSPAWELSIASELDKLGARWRACMIRQLRAFKGRRPGVLPVMPDIVAAVAAEAGAGREVWIAPKVDREALARACADHVFRHILLLNAACPGAVTDCKLRGCTVGLMYLMRQGISAHGVVVLPRRSVLSTVLPAESHLQSVMGVRGRCITETENLVKAVMKSTDGDGLKRHGVVGVDYRMARGV